MTNASMQVRLFSLLTLGSAFLGMFTASCSSAPRHSIPSRVSSMSSPAKDSNTTANTLPAFINTALDSDDGDSKTRTLTIRFVDAQGSAVTDVRQGGEYQLSLSVKADVPTLTFPLKSDADHRSVTSDDGEGLLRITDAVTYGKGGMAGGSIEGFTGWYIDVVKPAPGTYSFATHISWSEAASGGKPRGDKPSNTGSVHVTMVLG